MNTHSICDNNNNMPRLYPFMKEGWTGPFKSLNYPTCKINHLAHILCVCALIFNSCDFFSVYPDRIIQRHSILIGYKDGERERAVQKKIRTKHNCHVKHNQLNIHQGSPTHPIPLHSASTIILLLSKVTFTPSIQPNLCLPHTLITLASAINTSPRVQTISVLSDPLYPLTKFIFKHIYAPLHSQLYPCVSLLLLTLLQTLPQEHSLSYS